MTKIPGTMTDTELYHLCKKWGLEALEARRKFIGLLPEVNKRRLFERRNFRSIYHFAAKLGGVSERLVNEVLRLEKRFEVMPKLHLALVKGEIGLSKLSRVASVADLENEAEICEKIRNLSRRAVDVFVKEIGAAGQNIEPQNGLFELGSEGKSLSGQNFDFEILAALTPAVKIKLKGLIDKKIDINVILLNALAEREVGIAGLKEKLAIEQKKQQMDRGVIGMSIPRSIPAAIRKVIKLEFGSTCSCRGCDYTAEQIHHEKHFAYHRSHDPHYLKPLCRGHHELEHAKKHPDRVVYTA